MVASSSLLIRRARILLPTGEFLMGDVHIQDREIVQVGPDLSIPDESEAVLLTRTD